MSAFPIHRRRNENILNYIQKRGSTLSLEGLANIRTALILLSTKLEQTFEENQCISCRPFIDVTRTDNVCYVIGKVPDLESKVWLEIQYDIAKVGYSVKEHVITDLPPKINGAVFQDKVFQLDELVTLLFRLYVHGAASLS